MGFDGEYTGLNRRRDRFVQYGVHGVEADGETVVDAHAVVDAETPVGRDPATIPGVRATEVADAVPMRAGHLQRLKRLLDGAVVAIHKEDVDWPLLLAEYRRAGLPPPEPYEIVCTLKLARSAGLPPPHDLATLCRRFRVPLEHAHNARHDAKAAFGVLVALVNLRWMAWGDPHPRRRCSWAVRSAHWPPRRFRALALNAASPRAWPKTSSSGPE